MTKFLEVKEVQVFPRVPNEHIAYRLTPRNRGSAYYAERTDRNSGWITPEEQEILRRSVVGIAGCGGMGGLVAATFARLGIGEIRIADCERFDVSNIQRQFAARIATIGKSKAFETARMIREITDDMVLTVYPQGITGETTTSFLDGCDIVCDEIEFWAIGARILLHEQAKLARVPLMNCSTVGFGTRLFLFDHKGMSMEDMLGFSRSQAYFLQERIESQCAKPEEIQHVLCAVLNALVPELPEYYSRDYNISSRALCIERLRKECKAPIIATNPPLATGFLANHVLLHLLGHSPIPRNVLYPPKTPGYLYFDAARMEAKKVEREEIVDEYAT